MYALSELNQHGIPSLLSGIGHKDQWKTKRENIKRRWLETIGEVPDRVQTNIRILKEEQEADHVRQHIVYDTVFGDKVTAYLLIPNTVLEKSRKVPAVIALHGTSEYGKDNVATAKGKENRQYGLELVSRGYVVLAPDALSAGERIYPGHQAFHNAPFYEQYPEWSATAKDLVDHMHGIDLLQSLPFVDAGALGAIGHSYGAYSAFFLAGMDQRVKAVVSSCGLYTLTGDPRPDRWGVRDWYTHIPKMTEHIRNNRIPFEFHEIAALAAPTPFFNWTGQSDHIAPHWEAIGEAIHDLYQLYQWLGAADRFWSFIGPGGHDFPPEIRSLSYDFLDKWLRSS